VAFIFVPYLTLGISSLFPGFEGWQTETLGFPIPPFIYVTEVGLSFSSSCTGKLATGLHFTISNTKYNLRGSCPDGAVVHAGGWA
jgi:hypothetical protein